MRTPSPGSNRQARGFTLIELMVALVVMAIVVGFIMGVLHRSQSQSQRVTSVAERRQMARSAVQLLEREMRMAGSGFGTDTVMAGRGGAAWTLYAINPGYGGTAANDSVTLVGGWLGTTTLSTAMASSSSNMMLDSIPSAFTTGSFVVLTNGSSTHMFQITGVTASPAQFAHASTSNYNTGQVQWPVGGGYPAHSTFVYKSMLVTYRFDATTYSKPALVRQELGGAQSVVAYDISGFRVYYEMQDGTITRSPGSMAFVNKVVPVVLTSVTSSRFPTLQDSVYAAIRPRTF